VRITHPFHPYGGQQFACVAERSNLYGMRLLLSVAHDEVCAVPRQWTDLVAPDPEIVLGRGRALLRVADLVALETLVARIRVETRGTRPEVSSELRRICQVK